MTSPHQIDQRQTETYRLRQSLIEELNPVLDHGYVKLIDFLGDDASIVEAARMSTGRGFVSWEPYKRCRRCDALDLGTGGPVPGPEGCQESGHSYENYPNGDRGLLDTLWRKKHASPFEMCEMVIEVQAPLFVFREWHRHRTQSYNEFSARYSVMPNLHYVPSADRLETVKSSNKQAASLDDHLGEEIDYEAILEDVHAEQEELYKSYEDMLRKGVPKEVARVNTPVSRYSKMRAKTDLRNWLAFLNLRMRPGAQWEIRQYADVVWDLIKRVYPETAELFEEYDLFGVHLSRTEMAAIRALLSGMPVGEACRDAGLVGRKKEEFLVKLDKGGREILG